MFRLSRTISLALLASICSAMVAQTTVINAKGTKVSVDTSKWFLSGNNIYNKNTGNVGIGTNSPTSPLTITNNKNGTIPILRLDTLLPGVSSDSIVVWRRSDSSLRRISLAISDSHIYKQNGTLTGARNVYMSSNTLKFNTGTVASPNNSIMFLDGSKNFVGIGVATAGPPVSANLNTDSLSVQGTIGAINYISPVQTLTYAASVSWDMNKGANAKLTLTGNVTSFSIANVRPGMYGLVIVTQDATGNRTLTLSGGTHRVINGGLGTIALTGSANSSDILTFFYDGAIYWWTVGNNYN